MLGRSVMKGGKEGGGIREPQNLKESDIVDFAQ